MREYEDRLASLAPASGAEQLSSTSIAQVAGMEAEVLAARERVLELEARVSAFEGLPGDREQARKMVREKERELEGLRGRRDGLFEGLVGG